MDPISMFFLFSGATAAGGVAGAVADNAAKKRKNEHNMCVVQCIDNVKEKKTLEEKIKFCKGKVCGK